MFAGICSCTPSFSPEINKVYLILSYLILSYPRTTIGNSRHQTFATEKLLNVEKYPKSYIV